MDEDVEERYGSVGGRVFLGKFEVFGGVFLLVLR